MKSHLFDKFIGEVNKGLKDLLRGSDIKYELEEQSFKQAAKFTIHPPLCFGDESDKDPLYVAVDVFESPYSEDPSVDIVIEVNKEGSIVISSTPVTIYKIPLSVVNNKIIKRSSREALRCILNYIVFMRVFFEIFEDLIEKDSFRVSALEHVGKDHLSLFLTKYAPKSLYSITNSLSYPEFRFECIHPLISGKVPSLHFCVGAFRDYSDKFSMVIESLIAGRGIFNNKVFKAKASNDLRSLLSDIRVNTEIDWKIRNEILEFIRKEV